MQFGKKNNNGRIDELPSDKCTGCYACMNICPANCIKMIAEEKTGFFYPELDEEKCLHCGLCKTTCPVPSPVSIRPQEIDVYCGYSLDEEIRYNSTSGGFFSEIAIAEMKENAVVFGAEYEDPYTVVHVGVERIEDIKRIRQSKYVQSELRDVYSVIEEILKTDRKVVFCGTPCQCAALKKYLCTKNIKTENLFLIDFICHSVNSPRAYCAYLQEIEKNAGTDIERVWFKNKERGWHRFSTRIDFKNRTTYFIRDKYEDDFYKGFLIYHLYSRPSCHQCEFKGESRVSDITLADSWGIEIRENDEYGVSTAILHTEKGRQLFAKIRNSHRIYSEKRTIEEVNNGNINLKNSIEQGKYRDLFYERLNNEVPFSFIIREIESRSEKEKNYRSIQSKQFMLPSLVHDDGAIIVADPTASISVADGGELFLNYKKYPNSYVDTLIKLGKNSKLIVNGIFKIFHSCRIEIKDNAILILGNGYINTNTKITCCKEITIGDAIIAPDCYIVDSDFHIIRNKKGDILNPPRPVKFEGHVWLGQNVTVLKGVTIGNGACVGAKSLVNKNIPPHSLAVGNPAHVIREDIVWGSE